jgi:transcriptional regulator with XRE-family HTH domain
VSVTFRKRLFAKLKKKAYRDAYTVEHVKTTVPLQVRTLREQHEWTQGKLAAEARTTQTAISRLEDPNYGNLTLNTLLKIAAALDVGLLVKLVPFSRLLQEFQDLSPAALSAPSFMEELQKLETWAAETDNHNDTRFQQNDADVAKARDISAARSILSNTSEMATQSLGSTLSRVSVQQQVSQDHVEERPFGSASMSNLMSHADFLKVRESRLAAQITLVDGQQHALHGLPQGPRSIERRAAQ